MRIFLFTFLLSLFNIACLLSNEIGIISWNIKDFGKSRDDQEIRLIAEVVRNADIVAIQEVVAKDPGGAKAVARLVDELNRMGASWDYAISDPTLSSSPYKSERYAFIWKKHRAQLIRKPRLLNELKNQIEREPYLAVFNVAGVELSVLNYHACTHDSGYPERKEISHISNWIMNRESKNFIWAGDMNLEVHDPAFKTILQEGFNAALSGQKTSLKHSCKDGTYLSSAEDNVFYYLTDMKVNSIEVLDFIAPTSCMDVVWKRNSYSDHLPLQLGLNME